MTTRLRSLRRRSVGGRLMLAAALTLTAAACGDDDEDSSPETTDPSAETEALDETVAPSDTPSSGATSSPDETAASGAEDLSMGLGQEVVEAAQEEGGPVVHVGAFGGESFERLADAFEERYGISVENVRVGGAEGSERVRSEARAGNLASDTVGFGGPYAAGLAEDGLIEKFQPPGLDDWVLVDADPGGEWFPLAANSYGIAVNTDRVPDEDDWPTGWRDLLAFDEPMMLFDPETGSSGYALFVTMFNAPELGEEFLRDLGAKENLVFGADSQDNVSRIARGEIDVYFPMSSLEIPTVADAPVEFIVPEEGPMITAINGAVVADAPHPNAAKLWMTFVTSLEGQAIIADGYQIPIRQGVEAIQPEFSLEQTEPFHFVPDTQIFDLLEDVQNGLADDYGLSA